MAENTFEVRLFSKVSGVFHIPSYQRGYRWGAVEVERLLDDIYANGDRNYCLQPVVVVNRGGYYELVDGQQRFTTLYIILRCLIQTNLVPMVNIAYSLTYDTRDKSEEFLQNIDGSRAEENIDFFHMYEAYKTADAWFKRQEFPQIAAFTFYKYLMEKVSIIWYEVDTGEDPIKLFERLNIGKIPLTSAELVKAMFLNRTDNMDLTRERQEEISLQWDTIERELHDQGLWYFLMNEPMSAYQTNIDLILDLMTGKSKSDSKEEYYTFFEFDRMRKENDGNLEKIWADIELTFLTLKDWYEDHYFYHKIGYLIASRAPVTLQDIFDLQNGKTKKEFKEALDDLIRQSVALRDKDSSYMDWTYQNSYGKISDLLLLFNVESVRLIDEKSRRFPFNRFKGSAQWSLEHIHAQQSEGMSHKEEWKEWLRLHIASLKSIGGHEDLVSRMEAALSDDALKREAFEPLQTEAYAALSKDSGIDYMHSIANLALLNCRDNSALNNSTFDVKRNIIVELDKEGRYIPFCTKMVFLKYYTPSEENQIHFWGQSDRVAYVRAINHVLNEENHYLTKDIEIKSEGGDGNG